MQHILSFNAEGFRDYEQWQHNDKSGLKKINKLIKVIQREDPLEGDGQPEVLKNTKGFYSRRIDKKIDLFMHMIQTMIQAGLLSLHVKDIMTMASAI